MVSTIYGVRRLCCTDRLVGAGGWEGYSRHSSRCWRNTADGTSDTVLRQHARTRPRLGCRGKRGQQHQAFGRSRGGFSTKIHLKTDLHGHPLDFHLTGGEVSDSTEFETSLDIGPDIRPRIAVTDKGYDSHSNRSAVPCCAAIKVRTPDNQGEKAFCRLWHREGGARPEA